MTMNSNTYSSHAATSQNAQSQSTQSQQGNDDKVIVSFPLNYIYFIKPNVTIHESLSNNDWRTEDYQTNPNNTLFQQLPSGSKIFDNLPELRKIVNKVNETYASFGIMTILNEFRLIDLKVTVSIIGNYSVQQEMNDIRLLILKSYSQIIRKKISLDSLKNKFIFNNNGNVSNNCLKFLNDVSSYNKCSIYLTGSNEKNKLDLFIVGHRDQVIVAENKVKLYLDDSNQESYSDYLELDTLSILPLIGGTEFSNLKRVIKQTNCHLYLPNLTPELYYNNSLEIETGKPKIFITGLRPMVLLAKHQISDIINKISKIPFIKQISMMPIKRELLILQNQDSEFLENIMYSTGCFISIPALGYPSKTTAGDVISFQGNSVEEVDYSIEKFMENISSIYSAKFSLTLNGASHSLVNKLLNFSDSLSFSSNSIVSLTKLNHSEYIFQVLGKSDSVKACANSLTQFSQFIDSELINCGCQYQIELPNKEKDFITGKKNGKIIKIMNMSSASIKLLPFTDYDFIVEITCNDLIDSVLGLGLFEDELPTHLTFNVPESFHRQIIGVGGQTVQTIMRKFNVFIKFSNSFEMSDKQLDELHSNQSTNYQQSFIRKNNVVIKCPAKNKSQIPIAKLELEKLVEKVTSNSYNCILINLNLAQWKLLTSWQLNQFFNLNRRKPTNFITELEKMTNTYIKFPRLDEVENHQDLVVLEIYGVDNNSKTCCSELNKYMPYEYEFSLKKSSLFQQLSSIINAGLNEASSMTDIQEKFLSTVMVPMKLLFNIEIHLKHNSPNNDSIILHYYPSSFEHEFKVTSDRLSESEQLKMINSDKFQTIILTISQFLKDNKLEIISKQIKSCSFITLSKEHPISRLDKENYDKFKTHLINTTNNQPFMKHSQSPSPTNTLPPPQSSLSLQSPFNFIHQSTPSTQFQPSQIYQPPQQALNMQQTQQQALQLNLYQQQQQLQQQLQQQQQQLQQQQQPRAGMQQSLSAGTSSNVGTPNIIGNGFGAFGLGAPTSGSSTNTYWQ